MTDRLEVLSDEYVRMMTRRNHYRPFFLLLILLIIALLDNSIGISDIGSVSSMGLVIILAVVVFVSRIRINLLKENAKIYGALQQLLARQDTAGSSSPQ